MEQLDPVLKDAMTARQEGRYDEALQLLIDLCDQACRGDSLGKAHHFITMFEWERLAENYPPARDALASARDEQVSRLLGGDNRINPGSDDWPQSRVRLIVGMNDVLKEGSATYTLFVQLESLLPEIARREAWLALPAIVEAGDFALAERYMPDPLDQIECLNSLARELPLFPPILAAPRLAAELSNFMKDVRLRTAILEGLGRKTEAQALRTAALAGIASDEMRALAQREINGQGTIMRELADHRIALEATSSSA